MNAQTQIKAPLATFATPRETPEQNSHEVAKTQPESDTQENGELFAIEEPTNTKAIRG